MLQFFILDFNSIYRLLVSMVSPSKLLLLRQTDLDLRPPPGWTVLSKNDLLWY